MFDSSSKFLIVDDSDVTRKTVKTALGQLGLKNIEEASDGSVALEKLTDAAKATQFALVISDINMPKMNGFELLEKCRMENELSKVPFLIITSETQKDAVIRAVMQGVSGYIVKPFGVDDIKNKIKETFEKVKQFNAASV